MTAGVLDQGDAVASQSTWDGTANPDSECAPTIDGVVPISRFAFPIHPHSSMIACDQADGSISGSPLQD
jgi:hypothetical protein